MRGNQGVYNLEKRIYEAAVRGLTPMQGPFPVKFPLPDPFDRLSLRPGCLSSKASSSGAVVRSERVTAAIAGAKAAATQFSKNTEGTGLIVDNASEEAAGVCPSRGASGATSAAEHPKTKFSLKNNECQSSTKGEVSATKEGSLAVSGHSLRNNHLMDPTEGVRTDGRNGRRGPSSQFGGTNKAYQVNKLT